MLHCAPGSQCWSQWPPLHDMLTVPPRPCWSQLPPSQENVQVPSSQVWLQLPSGHEHEPPMQSWCERLPKHAGSANRAKPQHRISEVSFMEVSVRPGRKRVDLTPTSAKKAMRRLRAVIRPNPQSRKLKGQQCAP